MFSGSNWVWGDSKHPLSDSIWTLSTCIVEALPFHKPRFLLMQPTPSRTLLLLSYTQFLLSLLCLPRLALNRTLTHCIGFGLPQMFDYVNNENTAHVVSRTLVPD